VLIAELHADLFLVVGDQRESFVSLTGIHQLRATSRLIVPEGNSPREIWRAFKNRKSRCWKAFQLFDLFAGKEKLGLDLAESRSRID